MKVCPAVVAFCVLAAGAVRAAEAAPVPVSVNCTSIRAIQTYATGQNATDTAYLLVTGVANGKPMEQHLPPTGAWPAAVKQPAVTEDKPVQLWKGDLDDGQFVVLTVTLMQGQGADQARNQQFLQKLNEADRQVAVWNQPKLASADDLKKLAEAVLKADQSVIKDVKKLYSREMNADHYGGQFTLIVWNDGGKLVKRLDPIGLTFGEHYGNDIKIYSKLKLTRNNVLVKSNKGQWEEQQIEPTNDDQTVIRVKELETEYIKQATGNPVRHVTDYLVELQVLGGDNKPLKWNLEDDQTGVDAIHEYWNFAD